MNREVGIKRIVRLSTLVIETEPPKYTGTCEMTDKSIVYRIMSRQEVDQFSDTETIVYNPYDEVKEESLESLKSNSQEHWIL